MARLPILPPAPLLPADSSLWVDIGWRTWRGALAVFYGTAPRPIDQSERTPLMGILGLLSGLEVAPAEWVLYRLGKFSEVQERIGLERPPFRFVWSEKAVMDAMDAGLPFKGSLSLPTMMSLRGQTLTEDQVLRLEKLWEGRIRDGGYLWSGAKVPWLGDVGA